MDQQETRTPVDPNSYHKEFSYQCELAAGVVHKFLPIINAHMAEFFSDSHWDTHVIPKIQSQLIDLLNEHVGAILNSSEQSLQNTLLTKSFIDEIVKQICKAENGEQKPKWNKSLVTNWSGVQNLTDLIDIVKCTSLENSRFVTGFSDTMMILQTHGQTCSHVSHGMKQKKSHEIQQMTSMCWSIMQYQNLTGVIDVGSGRGYLGCQLALTYDIPVWSIDSSPSNSTSAQKRADRLGKYWDALYSKIQNSAPVNKKREPEQSVHLYTHNCNSDEVVCSDHESNNQNYSLTLNNCSDGKRKVKSNFSVVTQYLTTGTDISELLQSNKPPSEYSLADYSTCSRSDVHKYLLSGLHTCGALATTMLGLFLSNKDIKAICSVGCCYQHLHEKFLESPFEEDTLNIQGDSYLHHDSFPLSHILTEKNFQLGRNARLLAAQYTGKFFACKKLARQSEPVFWRAVLQVILKDLHGISKNDWIVGRVAIKCTNFKEYVREAFKRLKVDKQLTDEDIDGYEARFCKRKKELEAFVLLRNLLAPCVEALLLYDRLCYLLEQECIERAFLSRVFDPLVSPRCYAIVAWKKDK